MGLKSQIFEKKMGVAWWRHQMETFSALLALCAGNSPVPVNSPHKGQWRGALMFSFIYAWINDWVNNREAGDLRRQYGHYDVIVMGVSKFYNFEGTGAKFYSKLNNANLRDLIAATGLVILLNLNSNRRFFSPCDLEIWWMTLEN